MHTFDNLPRLLRVKVKVHLCPFDKVIKSRLLYYLVGTISPSHDSSRPCRKYMAKYSSLRVILFLFLQGIKYVDITEDSFSIRSMIVMLVWSRCPKCHANIDPIGISGFLGATSE